MAAEAGATAGVVPGEYENRRLLHARESNTVVLQVALVHNNAAA